jgi:hypothetical protein
MLDFETKNYLAHYLEFIGRNEREVKSIKVYVLKLEILRINLT